MACQSSATFDFNFVGGFSSNHVQMFHNFYCWCGIWHDTSSPSFFSVSLISPDCCNNCSSPFQFETTCEDASDQWVCDIFVLTNETCITLACVYRVFCSCHSSVFFLTRLTKDGVVYEPYHRLQSHTSEFDYLKSVEIEAHINQICWLPKCNHTDMLLAANDKAIKLWQPGIMRKLISRFSLPNDYPSGYTPATYSFLLTVSLPTWAKSSKKVKSLSIGSLWLCLNADLKLCHCNIVYPAKKWFQRSAGKWFPLWFDILILSLIATWLTHSSTLHFQLGGGGRLDKGRG